MTRNVVVSCYEYIISPGVRTVGLVDVGFGGYRLGPSGAGLWAPVYPITTNRVKEKVLIFCIIFSSLASFCIPSYIFFSPFREKRAFSLTKEINLVYSVNS